MTELYTAAEAGDLERVTLLVEKGDDKNQVGGFVKNTTLSAAAEHNHLAVVQYLVEQGADMEKGNRSGHSPLFYASAYGHLELTRYLLEQGANRDKADTIGWTSLHYAAASGHLETAKLLMVYGADLNARTSCRSTSEGILPRRSDKPSATSPDAAWTTATSEPPSKTDTPTQPHQLLQSKRGMRMMMTRKRNQATRNHVSTMEHKQRRERSLRKMRTASRVTRRTTEAA